MSVREGAVAVLTPPGRGAIAVVAAEGPAACVVIDEAFVAANGKCVDQQAISRIVFGLWQGEEVVLCRTSASVTEVHCHGGPAAIERVVGCFEQAGCERRTWQQWIEQRAENTIAAEARIALATAKTRRTAGILLEQLNGALQRDLDEVLAALEAGQADVAANKLAVLLDRATFGRRLTKPPRVVIAGRPNVGKSSLTNALLGYQRAIVFDQPGTTRDVVSGETALDGWPVVLSDVAGLRDSDDEIEAAGVQLARRQIAESDLVLWVCEASEAFSPQNMPAWIAKEQEELLGGVPPGSSPLVVANKSDLLPLATSAGEEATTDPSAEVVYVSALAGTGIESLIAAMVRRLVPDLPPTGAGVPFTKRQRELLTQASALVNAGDLEGARRACKTLVGANG